MAKTSEAVAAEAVAGTMTTHVEEVEDSVRTKVVDLEAFPVAGEVADDSTASVTTNLVGVETVEQVLDPVHVLHALPVHHPKAVPGTSCKNVAITHPQLKN